MRIVSLYWAEPEFEYVLPLLHFNINNGGATVTITVEDSKDMALEIQALCNKYAEKLIILNNGEDRCQQSNI